MKRFVIASLASVLCMSSNIYAEGYSCSFQDVFNTKDKYVYPVYKTKVDYYFYNSSKTAFFIAKWEFDQDATLSCYQFGLELYPQSKISIPNITPKSAISVKLKATGSDSFHSLDFSPLPDNKWYGYTSMIDIPYSSKTAIQDKIKNYKRLIEFSGNPQLNINKYIKAPVGKFNCAEKDMEASLQNVASRLKAIKKTAETIRISAGVNPDEAQKDFMKNCLDVKAVSAKSFVELDQLHKKNSKIQSKNIDLIGLAQTEALIDFNVMPEEEAKLFDL